MFAGIRERLTYADVTATVVIFIALGGGAFAAVGLAHTTSYVSTVSLDRGSAPGGGDTAWSGAVQSEREKCRAGRQVKLFRVAEGPDENLGSDRTGGVNDPAGLGSYVVHPGEGFPPPGGTYYVKVTKKDIGRGNHRHICRSARSSNFEEMPSISADDSTVVTEDDPATTIDVRANDTDADGPVEKIQSVDDSSSSGTVTITNAGDDLTYTPDADYCGGELGSAPDTFTYSLSGGSTATVSVTVTCVNDAPKLENIEAGALSYPENDPATAITATTTVADDSPDFNTGTLTVDYAAGGTADDRLAIANQGNGPGQIGAAGGTVSFAGTPIGTFTGGVGTTPLVVTLNASATPSATQALVRAVTFSNVSDNPATAPRTARFVLTDGDGGTSAPVTREITVTSLNDAPVLANLEPGALGYTENGAPVAVTSTLTVADIDSGITGATVTISSNFAGAQDVLSFTNQLGITGDYAGGVLTLTGNTTAANYQTALRSVTYHNTSEDPSTLQRTIRFQVKDGPAQTNVSAPVSRSLTVTAVNDAPVADDETFNGANGAIGNTTLAVNDPDDGAPATPDPTDTAPVSERPHKTINGDVLAGDTDVDGPGPLATTPGTFATNDGGTVTLEADGDFTFEPAASTSCTDTSDFFDYTVSDNNASGSGPTPGTATGRVTISVTGCVWYVNNDDAQGNNGTSERPFNTLAQAETASGAGHAIFVYDGNNTSSGYATGINLKANQKLVGEAAALAVGSDTLHAADAANKPTLTDNNADVVDLDDGNEVRGVNIDPQGTGGGIAGSAGDTGGGTIDDVNIVDTPTFGTQAGLELDTTAGTFNLSNLVVSTSGATGVRLNGNTGPVNFAGGGLDIDTTTGDGINATDSGTLTIDGSANTIDTTTGRALNVSNTTIGNNDLTFQRIASNGATNGIRLNNTANTSGRLVVAGNGGTCTSAATCTGGAIQSSTGAGVELTSVPGGVSLTRSAVTSGQDDGIRATTVGIPSGTGLELADSFVSSNGNAVGERGLDYDNVIGSSSITNSTVRVSAEDNARWDNDSGTLGLTVAGSTFADNSPVNGADGLLLLGDGTATMTANVSANTFLHNRDDGFQISTTTPSAAQMNVTFTGNDVVQGVNNVANNAAVRVSPGSNSDLRFKMDDNDLSGSLGSALVLNPRPDSTVNASYDAIVTNNRIGTGVVASGSANGIGIWGQAAGNGVNRFEIRNNTVRNYQQQGMYLRGNEGTGQVTDYTATGNTVANPDGTGFRILLEAGSTGTDTTDVCVDFGGAAALRNTVASGGAPADIGVARDFAGSTLTLRDFAGGDLSTYFNGRNIGTPGALTAILSNLAPAGGAAACALPATPPLP